MIKYRKFRYPVIALIIVLDQIVKYLIASSMTPGQSNPVIEGIFHITYVRNFGAAFSSLQGMRVLLIILPVVMIAAALVLLETKYKDAHVTLQIALTTVAAGGIGNLIDRVLRGFVVDMFDFRFWPVFNVADIAVCTGCGFLILYVVLFDKDGTKENEI